MKTELYVRKYEDYIAMGYAPEQAQSQKEVDDQKAELLKEREKHHVPAISQTKEEQEQLLNKMKAYAQRDQPEITASGVDFSKPLNEDEQNREEDIGDVNKEVLKFATYCYSCGAMGDA